MRRSLSMTRKIWLAVGVFVAGYVIATASSQVQGIRTEATLRGAADSLFPAAQAMEQADAAFHREVKGFSDAVMTQDTANLDRAAEDGRETVEHLKTALSVQGAAELAKSVESFTAQARRVYGDALSHPAG